MLEFFSFHLLRVLFIRHVRVILHNRQFFSTRIFKTRGVPMCNASVKVFKYTRNVETNKNIVQTYRLHHIVGLKFNGKFCFRVYYIYIRVYVYIVHYR